MNKKILLVAEIMNESRSHLYVRLGRGNYIWIPKTVISRQSKRRRKK